MNRSEAGKLGAQRSAITAAIKKQERIDNYDSNPTRCRNCNVALSYDKRENVFCGSSCSAEFYSTGSLRKKELFCLNCNSSLPKSAKKFCSYDCQNLFEWAQSKIDLVANGEDLRSKSGRNAKRYLIELHEGKCQICNLSDWFGNPIPLVLDHIDGNSDNNKLENLRVICNNCDAFTPTYKGRNIGKGRFNRRQRYAEGKSY